MADKVCALIGYGPGLGAAYADVFGAAGYSMALLSRSGGGDGKGRAYRCDVTDSDGLRRTLDAVEADLGAIDVVIYNADVKKFGEIADVSEADFELSWKAGVMGLFTTARHLAPGMVERGSGAIVVTGATAALRGNLWTTALAPTKASQRILAQSLAKQLGPKGIHVSYIIVDGVIDTVETRTEFAKGKPDEYFMKPEKIAGAALMLVEQDRSAWTFEIDLRPFGETW